MLPASESLPPQLKRILHLFEDRERKRKYYYVALNLPAIVKLDPLDRATSRRDDRADESSPLSMASLSLSLSLLLAERMRLLRKGS